MTTLTRTTRSRRPRLRGAFTALVTPFTRDGTLDEPAFRRLVAWQILAGIDGLVPCGTTGEAPTLTIAERERLIELTVEIAAERPSRDRIAVIAGTGTNDTDATIAATRRAATLGADAALVVAPYYNRPDGRMLEAHFRAVADEGDLPIVVYNVPSRTGYERRRRHVPPAGPSTGRGGQGSVGQPRADRPDLSRPPARRGRVGRRRRLDIADPRARRRWCRLGRQQRDPRREMAGLCAAARAGDWDGPGAGTNAGCH